MENVKKLDEGSKTNNLIKILKGSIISIIISMVLLLILSIILAFTNVSENIIPTSIISIAALSILIGSILSTMNIKKNGLLNGAIVGGIYIIFIYLLSSIAITGFTFNIKTDIMLVASILAGVIGGIIGVNIHK